MVVFQLVGFVVVELLDFELVEAGEIHRWSCKFNDFTLYDLVHFLQFTDVSHEVWRVDRARG